MLGNFPKRFIICTECLAVFYKQRVHLNDIVSCGISNQRETFVLWNEEGVPLYNAVVWQCKRSIEICERLKSQGLQQTIKEGRVNY